MGGDFASDLNICPGCHAKIPVTASFCGTCGTKVMGLAPTIPPPEISSHPPSVSGARLTQRPRPGEELVTIADPLIGATVADRYRILSMIGRGGMGVVYKVEHAKIGKIMALKLLTGELARDRDTVRRFKREALLVSKLSHPNTVQVFDYGSVGGLTYLAMEYLNGEDLGELVDDKGPRPFEQIAKIAIQACGALKEAHDKGMVHRDIKPENLFLTRTPSGEEIVKVLDFGLAKLRESKDLNEITSSGNIVGTPYYMPPEQVRGEEVDARGDVYALCALIYTCITGTHVFEAPSPIAVLTQQVTGVVQPAHERAPHLKIAKSVSNILLKGLEKSPDSRFQTVTELEEALAAELQGVSFTRLSLPQTGAFARVNEDVTATRDEVEKYERALRRREWLARATVSLGILAACTAGAHLYLESTRPVEFSGREIEPNHEVQTATPVPFGATAKGRLGRRIAPGRGDQDNYLIEIPPAGGGHRHVELKLSALPNMAVCVWVFKKGAESPLARYCSGSPGHGIEIRDLALRPGPYLFVVKQDLDKYAEEDEPLVHENVSDDYEFIIRKAPPTKLSFETEPNEHPARLREPKAPQAPLDLKETTEVSGRLNAMRDVDVVCATGTGLGRFVVFDAEGGVRPLKAALLVTPLGGPKDKIPVRLHGGRRGFALSERDQPSPWRGPATDLSSSPCIQLELTPNPLAPRPHPIIAPATDHQWRVVLEPASPEALPSEGKDGSAQKKHP